MRILTVDDDPINQRLLERTLRHLGHDVVATSDGHSAWDVLAHEQISFVISDWMMPGLDGPGLCRRIRSAGFPHYTYVILLTSKNDRNDLIAGMRAGADDFLSKPFDPGELDVRIRAGQRLIELERDLAEKNHRLVEAHSVIEKDLAAAADMQKALLPRAAAPLPGVDVASFFEPCAGIAGDIFNYFALGERQMGFYLLDVAGHGIPSAMQSFSLSTVLHAVPHPDSLLTRTPPGSSLAVPVSPAEVVYDLNERFQDDTDTMKYFTMIYGILDLDAGQVRLCQAGHPSPIHQRRDDLTLIGTGGYPIGLLPEVSYDEEVFEFRPGDRLFLYSDGVTECMGERRQQYTTERLLARVVAGRDCSLGELVTDVEHGLREWHQQHDFDDDVTILAIERAP
jgi:sigma-B regulation protein RsbU (phosphoserine phosphatase)